MASGMKGAHTRFRILRATAQVLNREGYAGTKLGDISDLVGLQAPAIYYHFSSRNAVIEEAIALGQRTTIRYVMEALEQLPGDATPMVRILAASSAHLRAVLEWSEFSSASSRCFAQLPLDMRSRLGALRLEYGAVWSRLFEEATTAGAIDPELDQVSAMMLTLGALNWATEWWDPQRGNLESLLSTTRTYVLRALAPPRLEQAGHEAVAVD